MIRVRKKGDRGHHNHGWLDTYHTFSFGRYHDSEHMGFRKLRVINEDRVRPGRGFDTHAHEEMEIISYVVEGVLGHEDSVGKGTELRPGDVQAMSAGTGISHSEFNASKKELLHFLQIWIQPEQREVEPRYEEKNFPVEERRNRLRVIVSGDGREGSLTIHQDAVIFSSILETGESVKHPLAAGRHAWVQIVRGGVQIGSLTLEAGDGAAISDESEVTIEASDRAEVLLFDLA